MSEKLIVNQGSIDKQANIGTNQGNVYVGGIPSRWSALFSRLEEQIVSKTRRNELIEDLRDYKTKLDGTKGLEEKLRDGNIPEKYISNAIRQKEIYAKKAERFSCYEAAQCIDLELFAIIKDEFDTYIYPQILQSTPLSEVLKSVREQVVSPIMDILWREGANDEYLMYNIDTIYGMVYYLTGMCHLNWKDYDNV